MKMLPILLTTAVAGVLVSAMVFASPLPDTLKTPNQGIMDRAEAYRMAIAD